MHPTCPRQPTLFSSLPPFVYVLCLIRGPYTVSNSGRCSSVVKQNWGIMKLVDIYDVAASDLIHNLES